MSDVRKKTNAKGRKQRTDQSSAERGLRKLKRTKQEGPCNSLNFIQRARGSHRRVLRRITGSLLHSLAQYNWFQIIPDFFQTSILIQSDFKIMYLKAMIIPKDRYVSFQGECFEEDNIHLNV